MARGPGPPERTSGSTLRVAVTDRCNLRCAYCMPAEGGSWTPVGKLPRFEEIAHLIRWLGSTYPLGTIRMTGGEPTLRRGLPGLVRLLKDIPGEPEVALTTNGTRLAALAEAFAEAGLRRVNISLDTLDPGRYAALTRGGRVREAIDGAVAAKKAGLLPVKINSVLRRSSWREDVPQLLDFALEHGFDLRFLELMHTGSERGFSDHEAVSAGVVQEWLGARGELDLDDSERSTPSRRSRVVWRGALMPVGWITPLSDPFCARCSRLRLDSRGNLRRCLMDPEVLALPDLLEQCGDDEAIARVERFLAGKTTPTTMRNHLPMINLGG